MGRMDESRRYYREREDEQDRYGRGRPDREEARFGGRDDRDRDFRAWERDRGDYDAREAWRPGEGRSQAGEYGQQGGQYGQYGQSGRFGYYGDHGPYGPYGQSGPFGQGEREEMPRRQYGQYGGGRFFESRARQHPEYYEPNSPYDTRETRRASQEDWDRQPGSYGRSRSEPDNWNRRVNQSDMDERSWSGRARGFGDELEQFGGAMMGRAKRIFRAPKGYTRSDERIREDVCDQLAHDPHIDPTDIEVTCKDGEVTLSGHVPERAMKWSAEQLVDSVSGVKDIHNQLRVRREDEQSSAGSGSQSTSGTTSGTSYQARSQARS